jgi:hypothetical protein
MNIRDLNGLEASTSQLPLIGFTVLWRLAGIRVSHSDLEQALQAAGFEKYLPDPPTPRVALRRALGEWIKANNRPGELCNFNRAMKIRARMAEVAGERSYASSIAPGANISSTLKIAAATEARIQQVLADYVEKKRGRPAGWSAKSTKALSRVSDALQGVSDEQIEQAIAEYRRKRRARKN